MPIRPIYFSLLSIFAALVVVGCVPGDNESRGQARELRERLNDEQQRYATLEEEVVSLREENRRLQAQLAAAAGGGGLDIEERQRLLDDRRAALDALQAELTERLAAVQQREQRTERGEREFYEATNMTMEEIGEARHIKSEYEIMRAEKNAAVAKAEGWLKFIWGVSVALGLAILACCILLYRSVSMHAQHRRETEYRRDVAELLGKSISSHLPQEQALTVVEAFDRLTSVDQGKKSLPTESSSDTT